MVSYYIKILCFARLYFKECAKKIYSSKQAGTKTVNMLKIKQYGSFGGSITCVVCKDWFV